MAFVGFRVTSSSKTKIETAVSELAHISKACLTEYEVPCKYLVQLEVEKGRPFCIGILTDQTPQILLEHYIQSGSRVWLDGKGPAKADLTGYVEPANFSMTSDDEDDDSEEEMAAEDSVTAGSDIEMEMGHVSAFGKEAKPIAEEVSDEEDSDEDDEEEVVDAAEDSSSDGSEDAETDTTSVSVTDASHRKKVPKVGAEEIEVNESDDEGSVEVISKKMGKLGKQEAKAAQEEKDADSDEDETTTKKGAKGKTPKTPTALAPLKVTKKRKGDKEIEAPAAKKKPAGPESEYERALVDELKRVGGRSKISVLGAKVQRPAGLVCKLSAFLRDRASTFVCDGGNVELTSKVNA
eukprot:Gregarina_sp_Pseudo_9__1749@NODE_2188_length_1107_cov_6_588951_g2016_i0_p1_GENE_NODE_2188_length_1107_cov_6_588951_g2016_i0NODE_2188_length_1107_cov_6_588951_g2016_i0_p1_ORF_typecomplete_len351_score103_62NPL/PF17800_1/1_2e06TFIIF_alpha/PF05793_12/0_0056_NODE_2188_length_1107_cov_6_588951_g2016_i0281080